MILIIVVLSFVLWWQYYLHRQDKLGQQLVADAYNGDLNLVKEDIEDGAPLSYELDFYDNERLYDNVTFNALHAAASSGNEDLITYLIKEQYFDINYPTSKGWTPLFIATRDGHSEAAKLLVFYKADLNAQTDLGATPLLMAVTQHFESEAQRQDLLKYMLKRGADVTLLTRDGHSILFYALVEEKPDAAQLLCSFGARLTEDEKKLLTEEEQQALGVTDELRAACAL